MKKILFLCTLMMCVLAGCGEDDYTVDPAYEKAEITAVVFYNKSAKVASDKVTISSEQGTINVTLKAGEDKTNLKLTTTISAGATVIPGMAAGFQDFSSPKTYTVVSPGKSVQKNWTITVQ